MCNSLIFLLLTTLGTKEQLHLGLIFITCKTLSTLAFFNDASVVGGLTVDKHIIYEAAVEDLIPPDDCQLPC